MDGQPTVDFTRIAEELNFKPTQVENVAALLDEGNTVPFITRYRKERTGNLDEDQIRQVQQRVTAARQLSERIATVVRLIDAQGKLTPELRLAIERADSLKRVEDLYLPYRPKRRSRATIARERGLEPLAVRIRDGELSQQTLAAAAAQFVNAEQELPDTESVLQGVTDILAEEISENADLRARCRRIAERSGRLNVAATRKGKSEGQEYRDYFNFSEPIGQLPPHRALAINRGEKAKMLRVSFSWDSERAALEAGIVLRISAHPCAAFLTSCVQESLTRLIQPGLERELRKESTERAEHHAISVFARNLRGLLLQAPVTGTRVLAVDPGFRTGCKLAVLDEVGTCLKHSVMYLTTEEKTAEALHTLDELVKEFGCEVIAIGNGTGCREAEELVSRLIETQHPDVRYIIVNEAGASIYSTSTAGREEFPDEDATVRGTISIGRRLQDPLSELVKIEPQHLGVGMYQHDVNAKQLKESLETVVESCVNFVGVDLNTASVALLRHVAGLNQLMARRIVEWRESQGQFSNRQQLLEVQGIGEATFTQAAGFLRIANGDELLDRTAIHPESYPAAKELLGRVATEQSASEFLSGALETRRERLSELDANTLTAELKIGLPTLKDIIANLQRPGRDPRAELPRPIFKQGILKLEDLQTGMELQGTILNVVDFGAFVDIGVKVSGLVHISQMSHEFVSTPYNLVSVGDVVTVWVKEIDLDRQRISLSLLDPACVAEGN